MAFTKQNRRALFGGIVAAVIVGLGAFILGNISGYEAKILIKASLPGINTLCNTVVLASATILALLLTLLSLSSNTKSKLTEDHYRHVLMIARIDTIVFVSSMIIFQLFNIPISEADNVTESWYTLIYYITLGLSAILSGGLISVVLMLYSAVASIIKIVGLGISDHPMVFSEDEKNSEDSND